MERNWRGKGVCSGMDDGRWAMSEVQMRWGRVRGGWSGKEYVGGGDVMLWQDRGGEM